MQLDDTDAPSRTGRPTATLMPMQDGMPGPGWWIASDGRWYPPELHPDVRAWAAVKVKDPTPPASPVTAPPVIASPVIAPTPTSLGIPHDVSHQRLSRDKEAFLASLRSSNGQVATREPAKVTDAVAPRSPGRRLAMAAGLAAATLLVIVYFARGHDVRPSLDTSAGTTAPTTTVQIAPATAVPATAPPATVAPPTGASPSAPPTTAPRTVTTPTTSAVTSAAKVTPKVVSVFDLVKGNCVDGASLSDGLVTTIRVVDCSEVHTHEVYYSGRYPESTFDATKLSTYANDTCLAQFASYVGIDYTRSRYQYLHIVPTQESWTRDNDRDVVCVAFEEDATITGSIAGRAQ